MTTSKTTKVLAEDLYAVGIHGVTGQETEEGTLAQGTLVRNIRSSDNETWRFEASTDGGRLWYTQESYSEPEAYSHPEGCSCGRPECPVLLANLQGK